MKKVIRKGCFETNSSSTHSVTIMTDKQFKQWKNGELYKEGWEDEFYTKEEFDKLVEQIANDYKCTVKEVLDNPRVYDLPQTYEQFFNDDWLEVDTNRYTTEHGDDIVIVCKYGYD